MKPGVALDYAMGDGRNSLYLAKLGWTVYGFDISEVGVNAARQHAAGLGLKIDAVATADANYNFGKDRFDLILFSWSMPLVDVRKVSTRLSPGICRFCVRMRLRRHHSIHRRGNGCSSFEEAPRFQESG